MLYERVIEAEERVALAQDGSAPLGAEVPPTPARARRAAADARAAARASPRSSHERPPPPAQVVEGVTGEKVEVVTPLNLAALRAELQRCYDDGIRLTIPFQSARSLAYL